MTLIFKIPGVTFTDTTLPKLYRDSAVTLGSKWLYDALDLFSYSKQSAPVAGDLWKDLSPAANNAMLSAGSDLGFNGGFTKAAAGYFDAPTTGRVADNADGFLFTLTFKYGLQPATYYIGVAGCFDSNGTNQYGITINPAADNGNVVAHINGFSAVVAHSPPAGTIMHIGLALKRQGDGSYIAYTFYQGVLVRTVATGNTIQQPTTPPRIGWTSSGAHSDTFVGTFYRATFDDTSTMTTLEAITEAVVKDRNDNIGRFA